MPGPRIPAIPRYHPECIRRYFGRLFFEKGWCSIPSRRILKAEFYKLWRMKSFWGLLIISCALSCILLLDGSPPAKSLDVFNHILYTAPLLYVLIMIFGALFIGSDFENRTIQSYISAGHKRGHILLVKIIVHLTGCMILLILCLPSFAGAAAGCMLFGITSASLSALFLKSMLAIWIICAMAMLPCLCGFRFQGVGKTLTLPLVLFFVMLFLFKRPALSPCGSGSSDGAAKAAVFRSADKFKCLFNKLFMDFYLLYLGLLKFFPNRFEMKEVKALINLLKTERYYFLHNRTYWWSVIMIFMLGFITAPAYRSKSSAPKRKNCQDLTDILNGMVYDSTFLLIIVAPVSWHWSSARNFPGAPFSRKSPRDIPVSQYL